MHSCGHAVELSLFGKTAQECVSFLEKQKCPECGKKEPPLINVKKRKLPKLTGEYVTLARPIRKGVFISLNIVKKYTSEHIPSNKVGIKKIDTWAARLEEITESSWWVNNKDKFPPKYEYIDGLCVCEIMKYFRLLFKELDETGL